MSDLPYLTSGLAGIGGRIKQTPDDFRVDEIPLYEASGQGEHVYFRVVKTGVPTPAAVARIARHMGVRPGDIGVAGLKDAQALTSQTMSLARADAEKLLAYRDRQVQVAAVSRHTNKLRRGHLAGNRFELRIRGVGAESLDAAGAVLEVLRRRGVPNYFGPQRFGARGDTDRLGEALLRQDLDEFMAIFLGRGSDDDPPDCRAARDAFDAGLFKQALSHWPRHYSDQRRALSAYKRKRHSGPAVAAIDKRMKRLFVSALQSAIFNDVLTRRIDEIDRISEGDLARKSDSGGVFRVEDVQTEQPRAAAFEISPTGPIVGYRSPLAGGEAGRIEREALARRDIEPESFRRLGPLKAKGARRALRFAVDVPDGAEAGLSAGQDERGAFVKLVFSAPSGCYATSVLREIMKAD